MHPSLFLLLLLVLPLNLILPLSAASSPPLNLHRGESLAAAAAASSPPQQYIEITHPLPFDSLTPSCTLPLITHTFSNTSATTATYSPPTNCSWSNSVLHFSAAANGSHRGRVASVWLSGTELLRTSTPNPTPEGIFWNFRHDVTRYASLLRRPNLTVSAALHDLIPAETYHVNITILYYDINAANHSSSSSSSLELNENPADLIIPILSGDSGGDDGDLWFKIEQESDPLIKEIKIPSNTYRAVIEIHLSSHREDEFWYTNPPDYYLEINNLPMQGGHGPHRELIVKVDENPAGSIIPFPVITSGGINPLFWKPLVSIGAFDLPSYELELTPFLGTFLAGDDRHFLKLEMADALPYWLVTASLHLWLDNTSEIVKAGPVEYTDPRRRTERQSKFHNLDGKCKVEGERKSEVAGWVRWSGGNFTTRVYSKAEFENKIVMKGNATRKTVKAAVKVSDEVEVSDELGRSVGYISRERRYSLRVATAAMTGSEEGTYLVSTELEHALTEVRGSGGGGGEERGESEKRQKCRGWMFVRGCEILSGAAATTESYYVKDGYGCCGRRVVAEGGAVKNDTDNICKPAVVIAAAAS